MSRTPSKKKFRSGSKKKGESNEYKTKMNEESKYYEKKENVYFDRVSQMPDLEIYNPSYMVAALYLRDSNIRNFEYEDDRVIFPTAMFKEGPHNNALTRAINKLSTKEIKDTTKIKEELYIYLTRIENFLSENIKNSTVPNNSYDDVEESYESQDDVSDEDYARENPE